MKHLRQLCLGLFLVLALSIPAFGGDINTPGIAGDIPCPGVTGDIGTPGVTGHIPCPGVTGEIPNGITGEISTHGVAGNIPNNVAGEIPIWYHRGNLDTGAWLHPGVAFLSLWKRFQSSTYALVRSGFLPGERRITNVSANPISRKQTLCCRLMKNLRWKTRGARARSQFAIFAILGLEGVSLALSGQQHPLKLRTP